MTVILAADTTTSINSVAVCRGPQLLAESVVDCQRLHSERLLATVEWVLQEAQLTLGDVELLAISIGPGSFTGLRIGAATWKGLALGRQLPLMGVPTLDAMTRLGLFDNAVVCPLLDARMREVFGALYRFRSGQREKIGPDRVCPVEDLAGEAVKTAAEENVPLWFFGDGALVYRERIIARAPEANFAPAWWGVPRASAVAAEALAMRERGVTADAANVSPVYLRMSQPEEKRARNAGSVQHE